MVEDRVKYEVVGDVALITLNDPPSLNALSDEMLEALSAALVQAEKEARAVVLTGAGRGFCSGAKLNSISLSQNAGRDMGARLESHTNPLMRLIRNLSKPIVTAVNGAAAGSGCSLALSGDLIVASEAAFFLQAFQRVGLVPDAGSAFLLTNAIGKVRAMEMMMLGEKIAAGKALEWGLVSRVVAGQDVLPVAMDLAVRLASGPTNALGMTRRLCWQSLETPFDVQLDQERNAQKAAGRDPDFEEGVRAFREKRAARFNGGDQNDRPQTQ